MTAANLAFADEAPQTREANHAELKFEWSSSSIPFNFKNELKKDASDAWNLCKTQIMNHKISKIDLSKKVYGLMNVDDPGNSSSEKLARACVAASLTGKLSRYMDDQSVKNPPVDKIVDIVLDILQGKEDAVPQNIIPTDENKTNYVSEYNDALNNKTKDGIIYKSGTQHRVQPSAWEANNLVDMNELARETAAERIKSVRSKGKEVQQELDDMLKNASDGLNRDIVERNQKAVEAMQQLQEELDALEKELKKNAKDVKDATAKNAKDAKDAAAKEAEKREDTAQKKISDFLLTEEAKTFIGEQKTNNVTSAYIAAALLNKYPLLAESAKNDKDELSGKTRDRVKKMLDELYGSK